MAEPLTFAAHTSYVLGLVFSPDSDTLVSSGMDRVVRLWSAADWQLLRTLEGHTQSVNSIALSPDGTTLATGSTDASVRLWSFPELRPLHTLADRKKTVAAVRSVRLENGDAPLGGFAPLKGEE